RPSGAAALLVFLAAAAGAGVVAPGLGAAQHLPDARAQALPDAVEVVHRPDGLAESLHALLAGAGWAVLGVHADGGRALVVLGQRRDGVQRIVDPAGRLLVARQLPVLRPDVHHEQEAHRPHLPKNRHLLALHLHTLILRQAGNNATH